MSTEAVTFKDISDAGKVQRGRYHRAGARANSQQARVFKVGGEWMTCARIAQHAGRCMKTVVKKARQLRAEGKREFLIEDFQ